MELNDIRREIDKIDTELVELFCARMALSAQMADYKKANGLPISVPTREEAILRQVGEQAGAELGDYARGLYEQIFALSRAYQEKRWEDTGVME